MRAVIQRVSSAQVTVEGKKVASIDKGILTLLGVAKGDSEEQLKKVIQKICDLRIFEDADGKMNLSLKQVNGQHLIVSQFTLLADVTQGRRPSFIQAEEPVRAKQLFEKAVELSQAEGVTTQQGVFQADMKVDLRNDGPVTLVLDF